MAGELQYQSEAGANAGKLFYIEAGADLGKLTHECCCGADCGFCGVGQTPKSYDVVVAGINACPCTVELGADGTSAEAVCTIDANFRVTQDAVNSCLWTNDSVGTIEVWRYVDEDDCTGDFTYETGKAYARLTRIAGATWIFRIIAAGFVRPPIAPLTGWAWAFDGTKVTFNCDMNFVVDNAQVCTYNTGAANLYQLCEDGTASFTVV